MHTRLAALTGFISPAAPVWRRRAAAGVQRHAAVAPAPAPAAAPADEGDAEQVVLYGLSRDLGIPAATLKAQRERTNIGWGDLLIANRLAQKTGLTFEQVVAELDREALFHIVWAAFAARRLDKQ